MKNYQSSDALLRGDIYEGVRHFQSNRPDNGPSIQINGLNIDALAVQVDNQEHNPNLCFLLSTSMSYSDALKKKFGKFCIKITNLEGLCSEIQRILDSIVDDERQIVTHHGIVEYYSEKDFCDSLTKSTPAYMRKRDIYRCEQEYRVFFELTNLALRGQQSRYKLENIPLTIHAEGNLAKVFDFQIPNMQKYACTQP